mgnify:CR=1 FL=1
MSAKLACGISVGIAVFLALFLGIGFGEIYQKKYQEEERRRKEEELKEVCPYLLFMSFNCIGHHVYFFMCLNTFSFILDFWTQLQKKKKHLKKSKRKARHEKAI